MSVTDRRWEKLRSTLVAMMNEPIDMEAMVKLSPVHVSSMDSKLEEKVEAQQQICNLRKQLADMQEALDLRVCLANC